MELMALSYLIYSWMVFKMCPIENITQISSVEYNGGWYPIHTFKSCYEIRGYYQSSTGGIFVNAQMNQSERDDVVRAELCHTNQTLPKREDADYYDMWMQNEVSCGHINRFEKNLEGWI